MPGCRSYARERERNIARRAERYRKYVELIRTYCPQHEEVLVGQDAILGYLHKIGIRRPSLRPLSWRQITRWTRERDFPLCNGGVDRLAAGARWSPPYTSTALVWAWLCSTWCSADRREVAVLYPARNADSDIACGDSINRPTSVEPPTRPSER